MTQFYKPEASIEALRESMRIFESLKSLEEAMQKGTILEAPVLLCDENRNLVLRLGKFKAIMPKDEVVYSLSEQETKDIAIITRVGKSVCFKITGFKKENDETIVMLSRRLAQKECWENFVSHLKSGDIIDAKVTHCESFGCFCDIGCGIISLLSIDCISVSRISHPKERFYIGQRIKAAVRTPCDQWGRITITHKELLGTWEENAGNFSVGQTVAGIIRSVESYGIFVELAPNLAGLAEWREDIKVGSTSAVYIKSIIPEKMKIKLVIVDPQSSVYSHYDYALQANQAEREYYFDGKHISKWQYSPSCCNKIVETVFDR